MSAHMKMHHTDPFQYSDSKKTQASKPGNVVYNNDLFREWYGNMPKGAVMLSGLRNREGLTQKEMGDLLGINQGNISKMENGKREIGKTLAKRLAKLFKTDYRIFL